MAEEVVDVLLCPSRDNAAELPIDIKSVETIFELTDILKAGAGCIALSHPRVLKVLVDYADLFGVKLSLLTGVPGCDYDVPFEQCTWSLDRVSYDGLVLEANALDRMEQLKQAERPRVAGGRPRPESRDEVAQLTIPTAVDYDSSDDDE